MRPSRIALSIAAAALLFFSAKAASAAPDEHARLTTLWNAVQNQNMPQRDRQIAQYDLAVGLYEMGMLQASYGVFAEIADKPTHVRFEATLPWLARLAMKLPEPADVAERIGKYTPQMIARFDAPATQGIYWRLSFMLGSYKYRNRQYDEAIALFGKVAPSSRLYDKAQFMIGISQVQLHRAAPAIVAFRGVADRHPKP
jgi:hypothetical protein